jgi:hypothetical protein
MPAASRILMKNTVHLKSHSTVARAKDFDEGEKFLLPGFNVVLGYQREKSEYISLPKGAAP